jgi:hypothetical protein
MSLRNVGLTFKGLHGVISQKVVALYNHRCENLKSFRLSISPQVDVLVF